MMASGVYFISMSPLEELDRLATMLRKRIRCNARKSARFFKKAHRGLEESKIIYLGKMKSSPEYPRLEQALDGILNDAVENYKMERWWAESAMGFKIDKELIDAFVSEWEKAPGASDETVH